MATFFVYIQIINMKLRWTVILAVINAVLLWVVVTHVISPPGRQAFDSQVRTFLPLNKADWDGLGLKTTGTTWKVTRDRWGHWWLRSPVEWPAKAALVSRMNGYLSTLAVDSAFAATELGRVGQDLKSYGLDNPRAILEVMSGSKTLSYKIGNTTPLGNKVYVLSADEKEVWVVDAGINEYLTYSPEALREEGLLPFSPVELEAMEVEKEGLTTRYERKTGSNQWQIKIAGQTLPIRPGAWESWLGALLKNRPASTEVLAQNFNALARINFQTLYGRRSLTVGELTKDGTQRVARWEGSLEVFLAPAEVLPTSEDFLEARALPLQPKDITAIDWNTEGSLLSLRKLETGQWVIASDGNITADGVLIEVLLQDLCAAQATPKITGRATAKGAEQLTLQTSAEKITLQLTRSPEGVGLQREDSPVSYSAKLWPIRPASTDLADRHLLGPVDSVKSVIFKTLPGEVKKEFAEGSPQTEALRALASNVLRVRRWLKTPLPTAQYQLQALTSTGPFSITLAKAEGVWIGQYGSGESAKTFEAGEELGAYLDTLVAL